MKVENEEMLNVLIARIREEFEIVADLGKHADIDAAMINVKNLVEYVKEARGSH